MSLAPAHVLSEDDLDELLYFSRTGDLKELKASVETLFTTHGHTGHDFIASAVDANNGNTPLHMAAANGYLGKNVAYVPRLISWLLIIAQTF